MLNGRSHDISVERRPGLQPGARIVQSVNGHRLSQLSAILPQEPLDAPPLIDRRFLRHTASIDKENDGCRRVGPGIGFPEGMKGDDFLALPVIEQSKIPTVHSGDWLSCCIRHHDIEMDQALWLDRGMRGDWWDVKCGRGTPAAGIWLRLHSGLLREDRRWQTKDKRQKKTVWCTHTLHRSRLASDCL